MNEWYIYMNLRNMDTMSQSHVTWWNDLVFPELVLKQFTDLSSNNFVWQAVPGCDHSLRKAVLRTSCFTAETSCRDLKRHTCRIHVVHTTDYFKNLNHVSS